MLTIAPDERSFVRVRAEGVLTGTDYWRFEPAFASEMARRKQPLPLLLDLRGFRGWTPDGLLRDVSFNLRHRASFSRLAVIGNKRWHKWITYAGVPIFRAQLKFFRPSEEQLAMQWLQSGSEGI